MTLYTVLLFYSLAVSCRAGSSFQGRHSGAGKAPGREAQALSETSRCLTPSCPLVRTGALKLSGFLFFLKILDQSFVSASCLPLLLGPQEVGQLPFRLSASSCIRVQGAPCADLVLVSSPFGAWTSNFRVGWNKGVNIYNFLYLL